MVDWVAVARTLLMRLWTSSPLDGTKVAFQIPFGNTVSFGGAGHFLTDPRPCIYSIDHGYSCVFIFSGLFFDQLEVSACATTPIKCCSFLNTRTIRYSRLDQFLTLTRTWTVGRKSPADQGNVLRSEFYLRPGRFPKGRAAVWNSY